jgi:hypothetical protein
MGHAPNVYQDNAGLPASPDDKSFGLTITKPPSGGKARKAD